MTITMGEKAHDMLQDLKNSDHQKGYYDYYSDGFGAIIRLKDKKCILFNSGKQFGTIAIEGALEEFETLKHLNINEMREMIKWAKAL